MMLWSSPGRTRAVAAAERRAPAVTATLALALVAGSLANVTAGLVWAARSLDPNSAPPEHQLVDIGTVGRILGYVAMAVLLGAWTCAGWLVPRAARRHASDGWASLRAECWQIGRAMSGLLLLAVLVRGLAQLADLADPAEPVTAGWVTTVLTATSVGRTWLLQVVSGVAVVAACLVLPRPSTAGATLLGVLTLGAAVAEAHAGHGMAGAWAGVVGVGLHAGHMLGLGLWLGTIAVVTLPLYLRADAARRSLVGPTFAAVTPVALLGGALVVSAGAAMGFEYSGGWSVLLAGTDSYVRVLALKVVVALGIFALGAWHWRRAIPGLSQEGGASRFRRSLSAELVLAALALLLSGILVALPAAGV